MYFPKVTQNLKDNKAGFSAVPGYDKEWGMFLLTRKRYYFNENFKGALRLDFREKKDVAWGIDTDYKTPKFGDGIVRTYYMNERNITSNRWWQERPTPTVERERFKIEWRHKWQVDEKTNAMMQYYKLSDSTLLKDYFEKEYEEDSSPKTYFLLTRNLDQGSFSFRTDTRVNSFTDQVVRLPELRYDLASLKLGESNFYYKNTTIYSNLAKEFAAPSSTRPKTERFDWDNEVSYPFKFSFLELRPFVGGRYTYYSRAISDDDFNSVRSIFKTGASLSTKFYRIYDSYGKFFGAEVNRLRHVISPAVSYQYVHQPSMTADQLEYYDEVDSVLRSHAITLSLENKLQTKRSEETVDFFRVYTSTPFNLKENPSAGSFGDITNEIDYKPNEWLTFYFDSVYSAQQDHLSTANFDIYVNNKDKWSFGLGKRFDHEVDDQVTTNLFYRLNPKWAFQVYHRYDLDGGIMKEQDYVIRRDLHSWEMDMSFNETRGEGSEIMLIFTLKAFPDIGIDAGTSFNKRKKGSQSE